MISWTVLIWSGCCGVAVLLYLKAVANGIDYVQSRLKQIEQTYRSAARLRAAAAAEMRVAQAIAA